MAGDQLDPITAGVVRDLARKVNGLEDRVRSLARGSQARHRSVEGGAQTIFDAETDELRAVVGELEDGSYGVTTYGGAAPPAPSVPLVSQIPGGVTITWDGFDANDEQGWPEDFARVRVHQSGIPGDIPDAENTIGSFESPLGGALTVAHPADVTTYVFLVAVTTSGVESKPSAEVMVAGGTPGGGAATPPASSPVLSTSGSKDAITLVAHGVVEPTTILDYYIDGVLIESTRSTVVVVRSNAAGNALELETPHTFTVQARNGILPNPAPSAPVVGTLNPAVDSATILATVRAGFTLTGSLDVGGITVKPPKGNPGDADYDAGGIIIPLTTGGAIRFPADGSPAVIEAILRTADLTVNGGLTVNGLTNYINGKLYLSAGIKNPTGLLDIDPVAVKTKVRLNGTQNADSYARGIAKTADGTRWAIILAVPPAPDKKFVIFDAATNNIVFDLHSDGANLSMKGVAAVGNVFYVLGERWNAGAGEYQWRIHSYNKAGGAIDGAWIRDQNGVRVTQGGPYIDGAIAADTTDGGATLWVARMQANERLRMLRYTTTDIPSFGTIDPVGNFLTPAGDVWQWATGGLYVGNADYGAKRFVLGGRAGGVTANQVFDGAGVLQAGARFGSADKGLWWDGVRFVGMDVDSAGAYRSDYRAAPAAQDVFAQYTWYDPVAADGNKESAPAPVSQLTIPPRMWPRYTVPAPPNSGDANNPASAVRVYTDTDATTNLLTTITTGLLTEHIADTLVGAGAAPPAASTFPLASSSGSLESASGKLYLRGSDDWRLGDLISSGTLGRFKVPDAVAANPPAGGTYTRGLTLIRIGQVVVCMGELDRASGFNAVSHDTGVRIPVGFRPTAPVTGQAKSEWGSAARYRYRFNAPAPDNVTPSVVELQQTAAIGTYQVADAIWITADP